MTSKTEKSIAMTSLEDFHNECHKIRLRSYKIKEKNVWIGIVYYRERKCIGDVVVVVVVAVLLRRGGINCYI